MFRERVGCESVFELRQKQVLPWYLCLTLCTGSVMSWLLVVLRFLFGVLSGDAVQMQPVLARRDGRTVGGWADGSPFRDGDVQSKQLVIGAVVRGSCFPLNICQLVSSIKSWARNPKWRDSVAVCGRARSSGRYC